MDSESLKTERKRRLHWLATHGYKATGEFTWECLAVNNVKYKLTLNANRHWYCQCVTSWATAYGDGRTPWTAEYKAYKHLGGNEN